MKEIKDLVVLNKVKDLYDHLGVVTDDVNDQTEFAIHNLGTFNLKLPYQSPLFRANFFSFVFAKNSRGTSFSDRYIFDIEPGTIFFNNPGFIKHVILNDVNELYLATLSESFLKENVNADIFEEFPFLLAENITPKILHKAQFSEFELLYEQIIKEYASDSPYRNKVIGYLFAIILLKIKVYFWNDYDPILEGNRSSQIVKKFKRLLEKHYRDVSKGLADKVFRVQEYAAILNLHPNYLNTVIKSKTGKPVGIWIMEKTITEARSLLILRMINTNMLGAIRTTQAFIPYFRNKKAGLFINATSIGGLIAVPFNSMYHATKWALEGWSESMSFELKRFGIGIKILEPGGMKTDFFTRSFDTGRHEAYNEWVDKVMGVITDPKSFLNYSTPGQIAEVVYEAATDGKDLLRYVAGEDAKATSSMRINLGDEAFRKGMDQQFFG